MELVEPIAINTKLKNKKNLKESLQILQTWFSPSFPIGSFSYSHGLEAMINDNLIKVKVWERGAGLTKACGTAACATAIAANINGLIDKKTDIEFTLGKLSISIDENNSVHMKGPVSDIENIEINI